MLMNLQKNRKENRRNILQRKLNKKIKVRKNLLLKKRMILEVAKLKIVLLKMVKN